MPNSTPVAYEVLITRWFEEVWNRKNYALSEQLVAPNYRHHGDGHHGDGSQALQTGPQAALDEIKAWHAAFPDGRITLEEIFSEGDSSVVRTTFRGTQTGEFEGVAGSGQEVTVSALSVNRIQDGKFVESWGDFNKLLLMQQIGAIPSPQ